MKRRWLKIGILLSVFAIVVWQTRTGISTYSTCSRCLEGQRHSQKRVLGIPIFSSYNSLPDQWGRSSQSGIPKVSSKSYEEIFDHPCSHSFKRGGLGKERHFLFGGSSIGCGSYPEGRLFASRNKAIENLYRAYGRIGNKDLARATYQHIDRLFPPDSDFKAATELEMSSFEPKSKLNQLSSLLNLTSSTEEWELVLAYFDRNFQGVLPLVGDRENFARKLHSDDAVIRLGAAELLVADSSATSLEMLVSILNDPSDQVAALGANTIIHGNHLEFFGKVLRMRNHKPFFYYLKLDDSQLIALLKQNDPVVDDFCFTKIASEQRFNLLDVVLECLNQRESQHAKDAINQLIRGPAPIDGVLNAFPPIDLPVDELEKTVGIALAADRVDQKKWKLLGAIRGLGLTRDPRHWDYLHEVYIQKVEERMNETRMAVIASALMDLDPQRTKVLLVEELKKKDFIGTSAALSGIGLIASPDFINALNEFHSGIRKNPDGSTQFDQAFAYAFHRCSGFDKWSLQHEESGKYYIQKY